MRFVRRYTKFLNCLKLCAITRAAKSEYIQGVFQSLNNTDLLNTLRQQTYPGAQLPTCRQRKARNTRAAGPDLSGVWLPAALARQPVDAELSELYSGHKHPEHDISVPCRYRPIHMYM